MNVVPLIPDQPLNATRIVAPGGGGFSASLDAAGNALKRADRAEDAFASHTGSLQDAVFERAQADVILSIATAAAQRTLQAVQSVLNMQI